jgi:hypothetical protein
MVNEAMKKASMLSNYWLEKKGRTTQLTPGNTINFKNNSEYYISNTKGKFGCRS